MKYDTLISLPPVDGLMPGMSAEVELIVQRHANVLTVPEASVVQLGDRHVCWVCTPQGPQRRTLVLGDTNGVFAVVEEGLQEGEEVVLNAAAFATEGEDGGASGPKPAAPPAEGERKERTT